MSGYGVRVRDENRNVIFDTSSNYLTLIQEINGNFWATSLPLRITLKNQFTSGDVVCVSELSYYNLAYTVSGNILTITGIYNPKTANDYCYYKILHFRTSK